jgi:hypothetical protein
MRQHQRAVLLQGLPASNLEYTQVEAAQRRPKVCHQTDITVGGGGGLWG